MARNFFGEPKASEFSELLGWYSEAQSVEQPIEQFEVHLHGGLQAVVGPLRSFSRYLRTAGRGRRRWSRCPPDPTLSVALA